MKSIIDGDASAKSADSAAINIKIIFGGKAIRRLHITEAQKFVLRECLSNG